MRVFIGIKLSKITILSVKKELKPFKKIGTPIKWTKDENLHLTLKFLGEIEENILNRLLEDFDKSFKEIKTFDLQLKEFGNFSNKGNLTIFWIGVEKNKELIKLFNKIEEICEKNGFKREERELIPHITLGRNKKNYNFKKIYELIGNYNNKKIAEQNVNSFQIFKSVLTPQGPVYSILKEIKIDTA